MFVFLLSLRDTRQIIFSNTAKTSHFQETLLYYFRRDGGNRRIHIESTL